MDRRVRLGARIVEPRGWRPATVGAWVVFIDTRTNRRHVQRHAGLLRARLPDDGRRLRGSSPGPRWANRGTVVPGGRGGTRPGREGGHPQAHTADRGRACRAQPVVATEVRPRDATRDLTRLPARQWRFVVAIERRCASAAGLHDARRRARRRWPDGHRLACVTTHIWPGGSPANGSQGRQRATDVDRGRVGPSEGLARR